MRLDNQEFNFNFINNGENIIRCSNVEEAFFNIFDITFDEQTSLLKPTSKYVDGHPIITLKVEYNNSVYEDVEFKVVASKNEVPCVFINEEHLISGYCFEPSKRPSSILEEQIDSIAEEVCEEVDWQHLNEQSKQIQENKIVTAIKHVEHQLSNRIDESLHDARLSILAESINIQSKAQNSIEQKIEDQTQHLNVLIEQWKHAAEAKISNYIISAIDETRCTIEEQFEVAVQEQQQDSLDILSEKIVSIAIESKQAITNDLKQLIEHQSNLLHETVKDADENIKQHIAQKLDEFKQNISEQNTESFDAGVVSFIDAQTQWVQKLVEGKIADVQQTLDGATIALEQKQDDLAQKLTHHVDVIVDAASSKIAEEAKTLHQEQLQNVRQCVDQVISEQIAALQPTTEIIVTEARNTQKNLFKDAIGSIKTEISSEMRAHVANLQQDIYKKFAIYAQSYAGGGTIAAQFADGGTMNGSLNVAMGQILSGGIDISTIFSGGGAADRLVNGSYQVILSSNGDLIFPGGEYIGSQYGAPGWFVTPPATGGIASADGQQYIQINNNQGIFIGTSWPLSAQEWVFGRDGGLTFPDGSVQTTAFINNLSAYATLNYVNNNFLNLSGGNIVGDVTIFGDLSCNGTQTFQNTIFSTTSAISVVHVGSGPALWVGNNGPGDIASFYDIDQNIEVLHVGGNNGSFPNVGVKTSTPNVDFTVNGELSASSIIYDASGNSNQWNNASTTVQSNSASWLQSISFNENTAELSISNSNTVSLSALSGAAVSPPDPIPLISAIWS